MQYRWNLLYTLLLLFFAGKVFAQQDTQFSQYMFNGIYINPAYAGYREDWNIYSYYRSQWGGAGFDGTPTTFSAAVDGTINNGNVGLGLLLLDDRLGAENTFSLYANYAYRLKIGTTSRLALGLGAGFSQYGLDGGKLDSNHPDPSVPDTKLSVTVPDIRAGVFFSSDRWYAGISADNLIGKYMNYARDPNIPVPVKNPHFYFTGGALFPLFPSVLMKPTMLYKNETNGPASLDFNTFFLFNERIWLGVSYRLGLPKGNLQSNLSLGNAMVIMTEIYVTTRLRLGYSYDFSLNELKAYNYGAHEISVNYSFTPKTIRMLTPRYF